GESANGKYPVEAVSIMASTIEAVEASSYDDVPCALLLFKDKHHRSQRQLCADTNNPHVGLILCKDAPHSIISMLSALRQDVPVVILTKDIATAGRYSMFKGVYVASSIKEALAMRKNKRTSKQCIVFKKEAFTTTKLSLEH